MGVFGWLCKLCGYIMDVVSDGCLNGCVDCVGTLWILLMVMGEWMVV